MRLVFAILNDKPAVVGVELWAVDEDELRITTVQDVRPDSVLADFLPSLLGPDGPQPKGTTAITTEGLRLPLRSIFDAWLANEVAEEARDLTSSRVRGREAVPAFQRMALEQAARRRFGRPKVHGQAHYREVARIYKKAIRSKRPTAAVAEKFNVSPGTAAKWVSIARNDLHLIPPTSKGKASGPTKRPARRKEQS